MEALRTDVAIIGGGLGACAAALGAARVGYKVVLTEETHWIGGQLTNQVVPPDEHPWIEEFGATVSYKALREGIRQYYRAHLPLTPAARASKHLNPGNGWVSRLCHDPRVGVAVLHQMIAPYYQLSGKLFVMHRHRPVAAWTHGDRVTGVIVRGLESGRDTLIEASYFIDATTQGELLDLAGVEHVIGAEAQAETGEPHASEVADPKVQQAITVCFAMEYLPDEDHTQATTIRTVAELSPSELAGAPARVDYESPGNPRVVDTFSLRGRGRTTLVVLSPDSGRLQLRAWLCSQRHQRGQLATK